MDPLTDRTDRKDAVEAAVDNEIKQLLHLGFIDPLLIIKGG